MSNDDSANLVFDGVVTGIQKTFYSVELKGIPGMEGTIVKGILSGKMRMNKIRVIIGDMVTIELDPYDLTKGRITYRKK